MNLCHSFMENDCFGLLLAFIMNSVLCNMCQRKTPLNSSGYKHGHFFCCFRPLPYRVCARVDDLGIVLLSFSLGFRFALV